MTRKTTRNYSLSVVAPFFAVLTLLIAAAVLAQVTGADRPSGKANAVLAQLGAATPAQAERPLTPWTDGAGRFPAGRSQTKRHGARPMDSNPPLFLPVVTYSSCGHQPTALALADVDNDGKADVVVVNAYGDDGMCESHGSVVVLRGNGDGTFQAGVATDTTTGNPYSLAVADVNGDARPDVLLGNGNGVDVLLGNGDGTFQAPVNYAAGGFPLSLAVADVNGDGNPDVVVAAGAELGNWVAVLMGNGDGTFRPPVIYDAGGTQTSSVAVADVNGDGKLDIVAANGCPGYPGCSNGTIGVLLSNGDGTFQPPVIYNSGGLFASSVAAADINNDGKLDLILVNESIDDNGGDGVVGVLLGNGDGTFQSLVAYDSGALYGKSLAVVDVNGDGKPDAVVANFAGDLGVLQGNGDGTFQSAATYSTGGSGACAVAISDINGDGKLDVVVPNSWFSDTFGVLLNSSTSNQPTITTLVSSPNPSVFGEVVTFTAVVSSSSGTPTGAVALFEGSAALGSATLANGTTSIPVSSLAAGSHSIVAAYRGSSAFIPSTSDPLNQAVNPARTSTTLASSANPARIKQSVTYTATVTSQYGEPATGTVAFQDGGATIATVPLANNQAAYSTKYTEGGAHTITATYSGDANNTGSISPTLLEQIEGFASKTVLTTSGSPSLINQPVTFTATVTSNHGPIPDGELVRFYDGATTLGSVALAGGTAAYTTSSLSAKKHIIKATYAGDATFKPSTGSVTQVVEKYLTTTSLSSTPNPSAYGQPVTFTATVTSDGPTPTGKVKFLDGITAIGSATLSGGVAKLTKSTLAVGTHPITAQYLGDAASAKSTSSVLNQVVQ